MTTNKMNNSIIIQFDFHCVNNCRKFQALEEEKEETLQSAIARPKIIVYRFSTFVMVLDTWPLAEVRMKLLFTVERITISESLFILNAFATLKNVRENIFAIYILLFNEVYFAKKGVLLNLCSNVACVCVCFFLILGKAWFFAAAVSCAQNPQYLVN